jgi:hypothetical protein
MFSIQEVIFFILVAIAIFFGAFLLYGKYIAPRIGKELPQETLKRARELAFEVVCYIEQILPGETGINKKLAARDKLKRLLDEVHINISEETLDMLIEAAVFLMNTEILGEVDKYTRVGDV